MLMSEAVKITEQLSQNLLNAQVGVLGSMTPDELIEAVSKLDTLNGKLQSLERNLLQYAEKLGLTPTGRVRLAQKRAARDAEPGTDGDDLYGD